MVLSGKLKPSVVKFEPSEAQIKHLAALVFITTVTEKLLLQGQRFLVAADNANIQAQCDTGRTADTGKHLLLFLTVQSQRYFYEIMLLHWRIPVTHRSVSPKAHRIGFSARLRLVLWKWGETSSRINFHCRLSPQHPFLGGLSVAWIFLAEHAMEAIASWVGADQFLWHRRHL